MMINPVNNIAFGRTIYINSRDIGGNQSFWNEAQNGDRARKEAGVNVPVIGHSNWKRDGISAQYEVNGERANVRTNPITKEHIECLMKDFFALDKMGLLHGNLSLDHLYFSNDEKTKKAKVEMDGFRHASICNPINCTSPKINITDRNVLASNASEFEESGLCRYICTMNDEKEQIDFLKEYLPIKSQYHARRADYLLSTGKFDANDDIIRNETIRAAVFSRPAIKVSAFELAKLNLFALADNTLKLWEDGCGKIDGIKKPNRKLNSELLLFDCLKYGLELRDEAENLSFLCKNKHEAEYFRLEKEEMEATNQKLLEVITIITGRTLNRKCKSKSSNITKKEQEQFEKLYSKIDIKKPYDEVREIINEARTYYANINFTFSKA